MKCFCHHQRHLHVSLESTEWLHNIWLSGDKAKVISLLRIFNTTLCYDHSNRQRVLFITCDGHIFFYF